MNAQHTPMVVAAARAMNKRMAEQCNVDADDQWKLYGDDMLSDAKAILDAAGAIDLLSALKTMLTATTDDGKESFPGHYAAFLEIVAKPRARAAIAKATGGLA